MGGCTLVKPVIGAVVGPVVILAHSNGSVGTGGCGCGCEGIVAFLAAGAAIGAAGGLVPGIIRDVQVLCGTVDIPSRNWWDTFLNNTYACR